MRIDSIGPISTYVYTQERERTWQKPDTPATDNSLKALVRNVSNVLGSVCNFGGGSGTVGIARIPKSYTIDQKCTMRERLGNKLWVWFVLFCYFKLLVIYPKKIIPNPTFLIPQTDTARY